MNIEAPSPWLSIALSINFIICVAITLCLIYRLNGHIFNPKKYSPKNTVRLLFLLLTLLMAWLVCTAGTGDDNCEDYRYCFNGIPTSAL